MVFPGGPEGQRRHDIVTPPVQLCEEIGVVGGRCDTPEESRLFPEDCTRTARDPEDTVGRPKDGPEILRHTMAREAPRYVCTVVFSVPSVIGRVMRGGNMKYGLGARG